MQKESTPKLEKCSGAAFLSPSRRFEEMPVISQNKCPPVSTGSFANRWISLTVKSLPSKLPDSILPPLAPRSSASAFITLDEVLEDIADGVGLHPLEAAERRHEAIPGDDHAVLRHDAADADLFRELPALIEVLVHIFSQLR